MVKSGARLVCVKVLSFTALTIGREYDALKVDESLRLVQVRDDSGDIVWYDVAYFREVV